MRQVLTRMKRPTTAAVLVGLPLLIFAMPALGQPGGHGVDRTSTSVTCSPSTVGLSGTSTCTATVSDAQSGGATPTGTVTFSVTSAATLGATSCQLAGGSCSMQVTGSQVGTATVSASYAGDSTHNSSSGTTTLRVTAAASQTRLVCQLVSYTPWQWECTATVTDTAASGGTPTGMVSLTTTGAGTILSSGCSLDGGRCTIGYRQSQPSDDTVTAHYGGDGTYAPSSGSTTTSTTGTAAHATTTHVDCTPDPVLVGTATACLVWAWDDTTGSTPPGPIAVTVAGPTGTSPRECMPARGSCRLAVTPTAAGTYVVSASYVPDQVSAGGSNLQCSLLPRDVGIGGLDCPNPVYVWLPSSGSASVVARGSSGGDRATHTQISCDQSTVVEAAQPKTTCTITVTGATNAATPSGTVTVTDGGCTSVCTPSGFTACSQTCTPQCTLTSGSCQVTLQPSCYHGDTPSSTYVFCSWAGQEAIQAHYGGDAAHDPSDGSTQITSVTAVQLCYNVFCAGTLRG